MLSSPPVSILLAFAGAALVLLAPGTAAQTGGGNRIAVENSLPGDPPSQWDIANAGSASIQGYAASASVHGGETVEFKVKTSSSDYRIDVYRMGYYQGNGARRVATIAPSVPLPQIQPDCLADPSVGLVDCGNWAVSATWLVPADATSGIYFAKLVRQDPPNQGKASHIYFVVRDDENHSDLLFQTSDTTWQAYNTWGGASLYRDFQFGSAVQRAFKVSYNRPINTRADIAGLGKRSFLFNAEYPMVRWLEKNGYDVSYSTGLDSDQRGDEILEHKVFLSVGQDEYWSAAQRANVEAARDAGVHLAFFSGNSAFWKTRWEPGLGGAQNSRRTLVCYKETHENAKVDPLPGVWTGTWRDPRFSPPSDGRQPENALKGTLFTVNGIRGDSIVVPSSVARLRFWRDTSISGLPPGHVCVLSAGTLGHEWEEDLDNGFRPAGLVRLSQTTIDVQPQYLADHGSHFGPGSANHALTLHRRPNGALVFSAGTVQWSWGLDGTHDRGPSVPDERMQQATVNLLADMGAQPTTLDPSMRAETASADTTPPVSTITDPLPGAVIPYGSAYVVRGTAVDNGGGAVGAVEVSIDAGATWHPASGREQWTYTWMPQMPGPASISCRAIDDSGNVESPPFTVDVLRGTAGNTDMLFGPGIKPRVPDHGDVEAIELGLRFRARINGHVLAIRFYKGASNPGVYQVHLWTQNGHLLASANADGGPALGWQQVMLPWPVPVVAGRTYVASFHAPGGSYPCDTGFFAVPLDRGRLSALSDGFDGPNGVFVYGPSSFPSNSCGGTNYGVDVVFQGGF